MRLGKLIWRILLDLLYVLLLHLAVRRLLERADVVQLLTIVPQIGEIVAGTASEMREALEHMEHLRDAIEARGNMTSVAPP